MGGLGDSTTRRPWGRLTTLAVMGGVLLGPAPAWAGGRFGRGFEDELGRIAAREVVRFGKIVLMGGRTPYYSAQWVAAYPAPGYEEYGGYVPPRRPARYRAPAPRPAYYPAAAPVYPTAAPSYPPSAPAPCEHTAAAPYEERIVWERYERVIQHPAPPPASEPYYDPYEQRARY